MKKRADKVIAYLRVWTDEQALSGLGLADQRAAIEHAAASRRWADVSYVSDEGFSAKNLARPAIAEALQQLAEGEAGVLVVSKLDRLSRSLLDFAQLMETAKRQGWELVVLDLAIDTSTPSGALMANVMASFAEYERQLIGQRTSAALQVKKAQGVRLGRPRTLDPAVTQRIVTERAQGSTLTAIADRLNEEGVPQLAVAAAGSRARSRASCGRRRLTDKWRRWRLRWSTARIEGSRPDRAAWRRLGHVSQVWVQARTAARTTAPR